MLFVTVRDLKTVCIFVFPMDNDYFNKVDPICDLLRRVIKQVDFFSNKSFSIFNLIQLVFNHLDKEEFLVGMTKDLFNLNTHA